jgi:hypothetical protein
MESWGQLQGAHDCPLMASLDFTGESYVKGATTCGLSPKHMISIWLVVWNINFIFPYIWNVIIPTDEVHHFSER